MLVRCPKCGYTWDYKGKRQSVTCPNCMHKFRITAHEQEQKGIEQQMKDQDNVVIIFTVPEKDVNRIKQKELWEKAGAEVVESSKDDRVVVAEIPDDRADEVLKKFGELLVQKGKTETAGHGNGTEKSNGSREKTREISVRRRSKKQE